MNESTTKVFTGNKIQSQVYKYLSEHPDADEKSIKEKISEFGINDKRWRRILNNTLQPDLPEASFIAGVLECRVDDLIKQ